MAEAPEKPKTLEMRVAELEDKLSKIHISEEEMRTYQKVAAILGGGGAGPGCETLRPLLSPLVVAGTFLRQKETWSCVPARS